MKRIGWVGGLCSFLLISAFAVHAQTTTGTQGGGPGGGAAGLNTAGQGLTLAGVLSGGSLLNAECVSVTTIPAEVKTGGAFTAIVKLKNTSLVDWQRVDGFKLGSANAQDNTTWGKTRINLPSTVKKGATATFTFVATAPTVAGSYPFSWQMLKEGNSWFGPVCSTVNPLLVKQSGNRALGKSIVIPKDIFAGQKFSATVTMKNTGHGTWIASDENGYGIQSRFPVSNLIWGINRSKLEANTDPNKDAVFHLNVTAPSKAGTYYFAWRMVQHDANFGTTVLKSVTVKKAPVPTSTPTPSPTPTQTPTTSINPLGCDQIEHHPAVGDAIHFHCTSIAGVEYLRWSAVGATPASEQSILTNPTVTFTTAFNTPGEHYVVMRYSKGNGAKEYIFAQNILPGAATPTPTTTPTPTPNVTPTATPPQVFNTSLTCHVDGMVGDHFTGYPVGQRANIYTTLEYAHNRFPISNATIRWEMRQGTNGLSNPSSSTDNNGVATNMFTMPQGSYVIRASYDPGIIDQVTGAHKGTSSCDIYFDSNNPNAYGPSPYDGNSYDPIVNPYTNTYDPYTKPYKNPIITLTAAFTQPSAGMSFARGEHIPITVVARQTGSSSDLCGTWELVKPSGEVVTLTTADFASEKLPSVIPPCVVPSK